METKPNLTAQQARDRLQTGNQRFVEGHCEHPHCDAGRRKDVAANGQRPFATIVTCSDSRVPPELLFDQGIGDLFVIRVAGNVCNADECASVEYAVAHLHTALVVLLGHTDCGAVTAVVNGVKAEGHLARLLDGISRALRDARAEKPEAAREELLNATINKNVVNAIDDLTRESPVIAEHVNNGRVQIAGAIYDLTTGKVSWM